MKLNELTGVKSRLSEPFGSDRERFRYSPDTARSTKVIRETLPEWLVSHGFRQVGDGKYATVYEHPSLDYVLKIFEPYDRGYLWFVKNLLTGPKWYRSSVFPKIIGKPIKFAIQLDSDYGSYPSEMMAIRIEKLTPLTWKEWSDHEDQGLNSFMKAIERGAVTAPALANFDAHVGMSDGSPGAVDYYRAYPEFCDVLIKLRIASSRTKSVRWDVGYENIMKRGDQWVITDPFGA